MQLIQSPQMVCLDISVLPEPMHFPRSVFSLVQMLRSNTPVFGIPFCSLCINVSLKLADVLWSCTMHNAMQPKV